jgi:hypothetical protein
MLPTTHIDPDESAPITQGERAQLACWLAAWTAERASRAAAKCGPRSRKALAKAVSRLAEARRFYGLALARGAAWECAPALRLAAQSGWGAAEAVRLAQMRIAEYKPKTKRKTHEIAPML